MSGLAALSLLVLAAAPATAQLAVDQAEIFFQPGTPGRGVVAFNVSNETDQLVEATVYLGDWDRDETGDNRFLPKGSLSQSCARYLRVFPLSLRLPAGASQAVRVALEGADSLRSACWSIVFVESSAPRAQAGRQITYVTRLGVKIYALPGGLTRDGEVVDMSVGPRRPDPARAPQDPVKQAVDVRFRNTGGMPLWVRGSVEYRRPDNSVATRDTIPEFPVLPGAVRLVTFGVPRLPAGRYVVLALLDYGGAEIAAGQAPLEVR